jgi:hypothetical protein
MTKLFDLKQHKSKKKAEHITADLERIVKIMDLSIQGLTPFARYIQVMETLSCLTNNKTLVEIHLNKYKRQIEKENASSVESPEEKNPR